MKFQLGNKLRDRVSGAEGITTAYITFLNGCVQWSIHPKVDKDGKTPEYYYFDEQQLELVDEGIAPKMKADKEKAPADKSETRSATGGAPSQPRSVQ